MRLRPMGALGRLLWPHDYGPVTGPAPADACGLLPPPGSVIGSILMEAFRARGRELGPVIAVDARERYAFRLPVFEPERIDNDEC
jgi:hypothetical protein